MQHLETNSTYSDQLLFARIATGDEAAFRALFNLYRKTIFGVALKLTKQPDLSEEITQEVFINLWVNRSKLPGIDKPDAYLFRILYNKISDYLRKESNRTKILQNALRFSSGNVNSTQETIDAHDSEKRIEEALRQLPAQQKLVYQLSRQQGLSITEIATRAQCSPHTVKSHLAKAISFIRAYLKDIAFVTAILEGLREHSPSEKNFCSPLILFHLRSVFTK